MRDRATRISLMLSELGGRLYFGVQCLYRPMQVKQGEGPELALARGDTTPAPSGHPQRERMIYD